MLYQLKQFIEREGVTFKNIINPIFVIHILIKTKYLHFFVIGISGVAINLGVTWFFTEFIFGIERYFDAYLLGLTLNLIYNFVLHTIITFQTKERHAWRFIWFVLYSLGMTALQAWLVKVITPMVGINYYLLVIASVILVFSVVTFLVFKLSIFNEKVHESTPSA